MPLWTGVLNLVLFWVLLWMNRGVFLPLVLVTLFLCCLFIRLFCYVFFVPKFFSKIVLFPCHPVVGMSSCILPLLSLFWNVLFCLYCFILPSLVFLLSLAPSDLFLRVVLLVYLLCCSFLFIQHVPASFLCLIFACCCRFLICVSRRVSHTGFEFMFYSWSLGENRFSHRLISLLHRLVRFIPWCCPLSYVSIIRFLFF